MICAELIVPGKLGSVAVPRANKSGNGLVEQQRFSKLVVMVAVIDSPLVRAATWLTAGVFISGLL
jgi:hypothetical protein